MPFNGIYNLRDANESVKMEPWQKEELKKCAMDPIYFIRHYVYINTKDNGQQLMQTYPFQDAAIKRFLKYRFNINRWSRQVGKSTIVRAFILWYAMFRGDQLVAMLANKLMLAKEQLQLLRESYIALPYWLQPGVKLWNKMSIQFSNGTRIMIAASSPDGIRGFSPNLLYLDEFAFLRPNLASEFMASVMPTISSGKTTRIIITSCVSPDTIVYTNSGMCRIGCFMDAEQPRGGYEVPEYRVAGFSTNKHSGHICHNEGIADTLTIETAYSTLTCSHMHKLLACHDGEYRIYRAHELIEGDYVAIRYGMQCWGECTLPLNVAYAEGKKIAGSRSGRLVPDELMMLTRECTEAMLQGMFDVSGRPHVHKPSYSIDYVCVGRKPAEQMQAILINYGILSTIAKKNDKKYVVTISGADMVNRFYTGIGFGNKYKQSRYRPNFTSVSGTGKLHSAPSVDTASFIEYVRDDIVWVPIESIVAGRSVVYDFSLDTVPGDKWCHSVIYNGMVGEQTPNGMENFYNMWQNAVDEDKASIHDLESKYIRSTVKWDEVPGRDLQWGLDEKDRIGEERFRQEYECEFVGSAVTLIDYRTLLKLKADKPMRIPNVPDDYSLRIYAPPINRQIMEKEDWTYVAALDTGFGIRQDYHVLQILLAKSSTKCEQTLVISSNRVPIEDFCAVSNSILKMYGNPPLTVEYNGGSGARAYQCLYQHLEYDNLINYDQYLRGIYSTPTLKSTAVMLLKLYVQREYLKLKDDKTIQELMSFTRLTSNRWGASGGNHDDHVTSLFWAIYYIASDWFAGKHEDISFMDALEITFAGSEAHDELQAAVEIESNPDAKREQQKLLELTGGA